MLARKDIWSGEYQVGLERLPPSANVAATVIVSILILTVQKVARVQLLKVQRRCKKMTAIEICALRKIWRALGIVTEKTIKVYLINNYRKKKWHTYKFLNVAKVQNPVILTYIFRW